MTIKLPERTKEKLAEFQELIDRYPVKVPAYALAKFFEADPEGLRAALEDGSASFLGFGWKKPNAANRHFEIQTYPLVVWYTGGKFEA